MGRKLRRRVTLGIGSIGSLGVEIHHPCSNQELLGGASAEAVLSMTAFESIIFSNIGIISTINTIRQNLFVLEKYMTPCLRYQL